MVTATDIVMDMVTAMDIVMDMAIMKKMKSQKLYLIELVTYSVRKKIKEWK